MEISFFVEGIPAPGGSKSFFGLSKKTGRAILGDAGGKRNKVWRRAVRETAEALKPEVLSGPARFSVVFYMPRPKKHFTSKGELRPDAPKFHLKAPDCSKLTRSTEDALKGITWVDDSQVVSQSAIKVWADGQQKAGARITVESYAIPCPFAGP
jgi:Holliday junction resolvase RusA-like endonuclease